MATSAFPNHGIPDSGEVLSGMVCKITGCNYWYEGNNNNGKPSVHIPEMTIMDGCFGPAEFRRRFFGLLNDPSDISDWSLFGQATN